MQRLLLSTAAAALIGGAAMAQTAPATTAPATTAAPMGDSVFYDQPTTDSIYASQFIGKAVYVAENDVTDTTLADVSTDWNNVGNINDVLMNKSGQVEAVLVDVGGFLGIGARTVAIDMGAIRLVTDSDAPGDYFLVFQSNRDALEKAPEFDFPETMASVSVAPTVPAAMGQTGTTMGAVNNNLAATTMGTAAGVATGAANTAAGAVTGAANTTAGAVTGAANTAAGAANGAMLGWMTPNEGYERIEASMVTSDQLEGANVYDSTDKDIGNIANMVMDTGGKVEKVVVDVGGFLGIGAKPVALDFDQLEIHKKNDANTYRVYLQMTKQQLEALPSYSG